MSDDAFDVFDFVRSGTWLDEQEFAPTQWAVPGLVPEGFGLFTGPPKAGKSWAILGIALGVAAGGVVLGGINVQRRPVLYLALEDGDKRLQGRCRQLMGGGPIPDGLHHVTRTPPVSITTLIRSWIEAFSEQGPLVILDTLGKVMPPAHPGESAYARDYRIGSSLKAITDDHPGSSLLVVHHTRKQAGDDWMDSTSGTQGLNGAADFTINLSRKRNEDTGTLRVTGRDVEEAEYAVVVDAGAWTLDGADMAEASRRAEESRASEGLGDLSARILAFVNQQPDPVSPKHVDDALGIDRAATYLLRLASAGRVSRPSRGLYASVQSVQSVFSGDDDSSENTQSTQNTHTYLGRELDSDGFFVDPPAA